MKSKRFWTLLISLTLIVWIMVELVHRIDEIKAYKNLSYLILSFMLIGSILLFYFGKASAKSKNKYSFIQLIIGNVMIRVMVAVAIAVSYTKIVDPDTKYFILPFIGIYFLFTIFETAVMYKLALKN